MHFMREYQIKINQEGTQYDSLMLLYALNLSMVGKSIPE
jgi:hypothetical protein